MQTVKQQAASQRRSLKKIQEKLTKMSCAWDDVDGYFESRTSDLVKEVQKLDNELAEFIKDGGNNGNQ